jgi:hypothetical protein
MNINLTKKVVGDGCLILSEDAEHLTNGHWAAKRGLFKQAALLGTVDTLKAMFPKADVRDPMSMDQFHRVVPTFKAPVEYRDTGWVQAGPGGSYQGSDTVLFRADDGSQLWIDRDYVKLFGLEVVTSQACPNAECLDPARVGPADDWSVIVMPKRIGFAAEFRVETEEEETEEDGKEEQLAA